MLLLLVCFYAVKQFHGTDSATDAISTTEEDQQSGPYREEFGRKNIYDRRYKKMAVSLRLSSIYARPLEIKEISNVVPKLAEVLGFDEQELSKALRAQRSFVWLGRHVPDDVVEKVSALKIKGIYFVDEIHRYYPNHKRAAHVVGFYQEEQGLGGVEFYYDNILRGNALLDLPNNSGKLSGKIAVGDQGGHLVLTLDLAVQSRLEKTLDKLIKKNKAATGMALAMAPTSGEILGLVSLPSYDPNKFWDYSEDCRTNRVISNPIYPGPLARLFQLAAAQNLGLDVAEFIEAKKEQEKTNESQESLSTDYWQETGRASFVSAPGLAREVPGVPPEELKRLAHELGFGMKSGIDLPFTEGSDELAEFKLDDMSTATTVVHFLTAFSSLVNGGKKVVPHLLKSIIDHEREVDVSSQFNQEKDIFVEDVSELLKKVAREGSPEQSDSLFIVESLQPVRSGKNNFSSLRKSSAEVEVENRELNESNKFNVVSVGFDGGKKTEIVVLFVLEEALIDPSKVSPVRREIRGIMPALLTWTRKNPEKRDKSVFLTGGKEIYQDWLELQKKEKISANAPVTRPSFEIMPDVRGTSLRKALQILQPYGLSISVRGTGRVFMQHPKAGSKINGSEVTLDLQRDN